MQSTSNHIRRIYNLFLCGIVCFISLIFNYWGNTSYVLFTIGFAKGQLFCILIDFYLEHRQTKQAEEYRRMKEFIKTKDYENMRFGEDDPDK